MIPGHVGSPDWLHYPHKLDGVEDDRDAATLDPHSAGPRSKSYT